MSLSHTEPYLGWDHYVNKDLRDIINKNPNKFSVVCAYSGFFGSLVYRIIAGTDDRFNWGDNFNATVEKNLPPLDWPKTTEGFNIYTGAFSYEHFFENHFTTAHIRMTLLEKIEDPQELFQYYDKNKNLLFKSHRLDCHEYLNCKIVRVIGNPGKVVNNYKKSRLRRNSYIKFESINQINIHNLQIDRLMSDDFEIFLEEYLELCSFYDVLPNINNVRSFILLQKEKLKRFQLTLS